MEGQKKNNFEQKKKYFVPNGNFKNNNTKNFPSKNFQGNKSNSQTNLNNQRNNEFTNDHSNYTNNFEQKEPIKCSECNGLHYALVCPNRKKTVSNMHTIQKEMTICDLARTMPRINATLENRKANYQTSMVEVEGKLNQTSISILIDLGLD